MSKRDVLDEEMARQFAWRVIPPDVAAPAQPAPPPPPPAAPEPGDAEARRARARYDVERCDEIAQLVDRAWKMKSPAQQAAATRTLLRLTARLGACFGLGPMVDHPLAAVRLWRLIVRHRVATGRTRFDLFSLGFLPVSARQREVVDLLVEAAETGDRHLAFMLDRGVATEETGRRHPELGARLAHVVDHGKTWATRVLAAGWLSLADFPEAIPALQRALRKPHQRLRYIAMFILPQMAAPALREEDVLWLLEDAVAHPLPNGHLSAGFDRVHDYEEALLAIVKKAPPEGGWRPLSIIADGGGAHIQRERDGLDMGWALQALAAGYPERALARIDRALLSPWSFTWRGALEAIGMLPDVLARPRLLDAAGSEDHRLVERAKEIWFQRFGEECPAPPLAGLSLDLLTEAPSERLIACLTVLRGESDEASNAMLAALLSEAKAREAPPESLSAEQREALALVLFRIRHAGRLYKHPELPSSEKEWVTLLLQGFGNPAFPALAAIAERAAMAGVAHGWLDALAQAAREDQLTTVQKDRLRDIAIRALSSPHWNDASSPLTVLAYVGAPPEVEERLWSILTAPPLDEPGRGSERINAAYWAGRALLAMPVPSRLDGRISAALDTARGQGDWDLFSRLVQLGSDLDGALILDAFERAVADYDGDREAFGPTSHAALSLEKAGRIGEAWITTHLALPASPLFSIAAYLVRAGAPATMIDALLRATESPAREGAAAAEAAKELVSLGALGVEDPRLPAILDRAPLRHRAELAARLIDTDAPLSPYRQQVIDILLSTDAKAAEEMIEPLYSKQPEGMYELFEELLPQAKTANVQAVMQHYLRAPGEAGQYWVDAYDEEEDEDDSVEADEDFPLD